MLKKIFGLDRSSSLPEPYLKSAEGNWHLPRVSKNKVYETHCFSLESKRVIKTLEKTVTVKQEDVTLRLLDPAVVKLKYKYKFIHIGLVQVALYPLSTQGLNTSILAALRDCRHLNFDDSLNGLIETTLCDGPVYFNFYPHYSLSLADPCLLDALILNIESKGHNMLDSSKHIALTYRVCYKVMNTVNPKAKRAGKRGISTVIETNSKSNVAQVRAISWKDISLPEKWTQPRVAESSQEVESRNETRGGRLYFDQNVWKVQFPK